MAKAASPSSAAVDAVVVGVDLYRWVDEDGVVQEAPRGEKISVSKTEFDRGKKMDPPALAAPGSREAKNASAPPAQLATTPAGDPIEGVEAPSDEEPVVEQQQ